MKWIGSRAASGIWKGARRILCPLTYRSCRVGTNAFRPCQTLRCDDRRSQMMATDPAGHANCRELEKRGVFVLVFLTTNVPSLSSSCSGVYKAWLVAPCPGPMMAVPPLAGNGVSTLSHCGPRCTLRSNFIRNSQLRQTET